METAMLDTSINTRQRLLDWGLTRKRLLVITGAGCSTEVGIPNYRDEDGAWRLIWRGGGGT